MSEGRMMRLLVMFDLPVATKGQRKAYAKFRNFLLENGFSMLQYSIYLRITRNHDDLEKYIRRVKNNLPEEGKVRCLSITDKQYLNMLVLLGSGENIEENSNKDLIEL